MASAHGSASGASSSPFSYGSSSESASYFTADIGYQVTVVCSVLIALETIFVGLRFYSRRVAQSKLGLDDAIVPIAWLLNMGLCANCMYAVHAGGVGRHIGAVEAANPDTLETYGKLIFALQCLYFPSSALPKVAIIFLYLRIFNSSTNRPQRIACYATLAYVVAQCVAYLVTTFVACVPVSSLWTHAGGKCINLTVFYTSGSVPNLISDVVLLILPLPNLLQLHLPLVRKIGLVFIFLAGSVGIVGACFRLAFFVKTENLFTDPTWYSTSLLCWSCAEPGMYLIAACLLTLGPLFKAMPSLRKTVSSRYRKYKGSNESGESDSSTQPGFGATLESEKGMNVQSKSRGVTDDLDDLDLDLEEGDEKDAEQTRKSPSDATSGDLV